MISIRVLTAETATPIFIDQLFACRNGFQDYLNLVHLELSDESITDIIQTLNSAVVQVKHIRISDLTFRQVSDPTVKMFAEFISYVYCFFELF